MFRESDFSCLQRAVSASSAMVPKAWGDVGLSLQLPVSFPTSDNASHKDFQFACICGEDRSKVGSRRPIPNGIEDCDNDGSDQPLSSLFVQRPPRGEQGILVVRPNAILHFAPFLVHPLFLVFDPHIQKWVIFVVVARVVCEHFLRFESSEKRSNLAADSLPRSDCDN